MERLERIAEVSEAQYNIGRNTGWDEYECTHGYGLFDCSYPTMFGYIKGEHIERIDVMDVWDSDESAADHAERHEGIKIIRDIAGLDKIYLDTPDNRDRIMKQLKERR